MRYRIAFTIAATLLFSSATMSAQATSSSADVAFWVAYWAGPRVILSGPEEDACYKNMKDVMFRRNDDDAPTNPSALYLLPKLRGIASPADKTTIRYPRSA
jgi:hypothetical protein